MATAVILILGFVLSILIPVIYFLIIPDLRSGEYIVYNEMHYKPVDENKVPYNFVFNASEKFREGKVIGKKDFWLIRKSSDTVLYEYAILGSNIIYSSFDEAEIPTVNEAPDLTVSLRCQGDFKLEFGNIKTVINYLDSAKSASCIKYSDIYLNEFKNCEIYMDCKEYDGYYFLGDILIFENTAYFRPIEDMDNCYEISLDSDEVKIDKANNIKAKQENF